MAQQITDSEVSLRQEVVTYECDICGTAADGESYTFQDGTGIGRPLGWRQIHITNRQRKDTKPKWRRVDVCSDECAVKVLQEGE